MEQAHIQALELFCNSDLQFGVFQPNMYMRVDKPHFIPFRYENEVDCGS